MLSREAGRDCQPRNAAYLNSAVCADRVLPISGLAHAFGSLVPSPRTGRGWPRPSTAHGGPQYILSGSVLRFRAIHPLIDCHLDNLGLHGSEGRQASLYGQLQGGLHEMRGGELEQCGPSIHLCGPAKFTAIAETQPKPMTKLRPGAPGHLQRNLLVGLLF